MVGAARASGQTIISGTAHRQGAAGGRVHRRRADRAGGRWLRSCNTSVNAELAGRMFEGYSRYRFALPQAPVIDRTTEWVSELPAVASAQDSPHVRRD